MTGSCFQDALAAWREHRAAGRDAKLVHGLPIGRGAENLDQRYWHAWVEVRSDLGDWLVHDPSANVVCEREEYYEIGGQTEAHVWRFTDRAVVGATARYGTYGPWVPGWESMGL